MNYLEAIARRKSDEELRELVGAALEGVMIDGLTGDAVDDVLEDLIWALALDPVARTALVELARRVEREMATTMGLPA